MPKIDAHQHFWKYDPIKNDWITPEMSVIRRDFLPDNLAPILTENGFDGCVVVQADQSEAETIFQLENAAQNDFIKGVVGWVDLQADNLADRLSYFRQFDKLKGFRHVLQDEKDRSLMLNPSFMHGIKQLHAYGYTYDILIYPDQLKYLPEFITAFPDQPFVIDHIAKPEIRHKSIADWKKGLSAVAEFENVSCKISGMVTEADWKDWKSADFNPYMEVVLAAFGTKRIMFGSDWPVCQLAATYTEVVGLAAAYMSQFTAAEQALFWGENAEGFYKLDA
ncbi:MAG: amidohydrolase family protein [Sphingobacteriaceae bacterium]